SVVPDPPRRRHRCFVSASDGAGEYDIAGIRRMTRRETTRREPAQVIVLFAIALIAMLAMVGVAVDGGTLYVQRRTAQNAADAAALAGARALQQATASPTGAIPAEICKYILANNFGVTPTVSAYYVDVNGAKEA